MNLRNLVTMQEVEITPTKSRNDIFLLFVEDHKNTLIKLFLPSFKEFIEDSYNDQSLEFAYTMPCLVDNKGLSFFWIRVKGDPHKDTIITFCKRVDNMYIGLFSFNLYDFAIKINDYVKADI